MSETPNMRRARAIGADFAETEAYTQAVNEEWNRNEEHAHELEILGRRMAQIADDLRDMDPLPSVREEAADKVSDGLDAIDEAIALLRGEA